MKKLLILIITILSALCLTTSIAGCNNTQQSGDNNLMPSQSLAPEENTKKATDPWFEYNFTKFNPKCNWQYQKNNYEDFWNFWNNEYRKVCSETLCLWTPVVAITHDPVYNGEGYCYIFEYTSFSMAAARDEKTGKCVGTNTRQSMCIYPKEWNGDALIDGEHVDLVVVSGSVNISDKSDNFEIKTYKGKEYAEYYTEHYIIRHTDVYANVYCGEICVATCYACSYSKNCTIDWIEEYLKTHLMLSTVTEK